MAGDLWNRVNIPFPGAASSVHIQLTSTQVGNLKVLLMENNKVLKLLHGKTLQTEVRVLYELLHILNNSMRGNKAFKGLKQVEQCVNRLKNMKLDAALQDLVDLCPNCIQMSLCIKTGVCDVPSQPMLEWICLKVLGASKLMSCALTRCSRAFILFNRQLKWDEFIILNMVITSMLSRLWVIFRGILVGFTNMYQNLLELLKDVAQAQPMPYLTDASLPADMAEFLGPSDASLLKKHCSFGSSTKIQKIKQQMEKKTSVKDLNKKQAGKIKEDLGVLVERGPVCEADIKPLFSKVKSVSEDLHKKQKLRKQVEDATTFTQMSASLEKLILQCKSQRMKKTKRLLTFLHLKCQRMKYLEAAGYNVQKKLQFFRRKVHQASSPQGSGAKTSHFSAAARRTAGLRSCLQSLKTRFVLFKVRADAKKARLVRRRKETELPMYFKESFQNKAARNATLQTTRPDGYDDIDDIFASVGL